MVSVDVLGLAALILTGLTAGAEFGSYAFVHPVVRRLPQAQMITFEQGLLRTFGRAFPVLMPVAGLSLVAHGIWGGSAGGPPILRWLAVVAWGGATVTTLVVNVPINVATARWDPSDPPPDWRTLRRRWDVFQGARAWLLVIAFALLGGDFAAS
jgi:uncharacterized membrane protein